MHRAIIQTILRYSAIRREIAIVFSSVNWIHDPSKTIRAIRSKCPLRSWMSNHRYYFSQLLSGRISDWLFLTSSWTLSRITYEFSFDIRSTLSDLRVTFALFRWGAQMAIASWHNWSSAITWWSNNSSPWSPRRKLKHLGKCIQGWGPKVLTGFQTKMRC